MAQVVAEAGATILLHDRDENLLKERQQHLQELGQRAEYFVFDIANGGDTCCFGKLRENTINWMG
jgi:NADP-dependent 3-hydroxy acid dehydrogenase YdfG